MKKLNSRGFSHDILIVLFVVIFAIAGVAYLVGSRAATPTTPSGSGTSSGPILLGTYAPASVQPSAYGKMIHAVEVWNNKVYLGYGDLGQSKYDTGNFGPLDIMPYNLSTPRGFVASELGPCSLGTANTWQYVGSGCDQNHEIDEFRVINGKLYVPSGQPMGISADFAVASLTNGTASWKQYGTGGGSNNTTSYTYDGVGMTHVFDMNTLTGSDLWMVGIQGNNAEAYCSTDGGTTWKDMQPGGKPGGIPPSTGYADARFYSANVLNGKLYLQVSSQSGGVEESNSYVFSGSNCAGTWSSNGPNLINYGVGFDPINFAGKLVWLTSAGNMVTFDGTTASVYSTAPAAIKNITINGGLLYALGSNNTLYSTTNLTSWISQGTAPSNASSIAVDNNELYVGTTDSKLYMVPISSGTGGSLGGGGKACHGKGC